MTPILCILFFRQSLAPLLSCDTDFTGGVLTISCGVEDDTISVRIDAAGVLLLNEVAITEAVSMD